jgi:hypothetical protein
MMLKKIWQNQKKNFFLFFFFFSEHVILLGHLWQNMIHDSMIQNKNWKKSYDDVMFYYTSY